MGRLTPPRGSGFPPTSTERIVFVKRLVISLAAGLFITAVGALINYLYFQNTGHLLLAAHMWGGEITVEFGFGWRMVHIFAMTPEETDTITLTFQYAQFFGQALVTALFVFLVLSAAHIVRTRKGTAS